MSDTKQLSGEEAIVQFKSVVNNNPLCMFLTRLDQRPIPSRPMTTQKVCDQGNFWFLSSRSSMKDHDISADPMVQLIFANMGNSEFLSVYGTAEVIEDKAQKKELWSPIAKAWFPLGVDDPDLTVLKVKPSEGYYWDTKSGKLVSMLKILAAAVTGNPSDAGVKGKIMV